MIRKLGIAFLACSILSSQALISHRNEPIDTMEERIHEQSTTHSEPPFISINLPELVAYLRSNLDRRELMKYGIFAGSILMIFIYSYRTRSMSLSEIAGLKKELLDRDQKLAQKESAQQEAERKKKEDFETYMQTMFEKHLTTYHPSREMRETTEVVPTLEDPTSDEQDANSNSGSDSESGLVTADENSAAATSSKRHSFKRKKILEVSKDKTSVAQLQPASPKQQNNGGGYLGWWSGSSPTKSTDIKPGDGKP